jgi:16S rRNA U516 pseudouridylate synthase RsuA-like enzyme
MCEYLGYEVTKLKRTRIMSVSLGDLNRGQWRELTDSEMAEINSAVEGSSKTAVESYTEDNEQKHTLSSSKQVKKEIKDEKVLPTEPFKWPESQAVKPKKEAATLTKTNPIIKPTTKSLTKPAVFINTQAKKPVGKRAKLQLNKAKSN